MKTISLGMRERIMAVYDRGESTRQAVARRFDVSLGFIKKLLSQRKREGTIEPLHQRAGRKAKLEPEHGQRLKDEVARKPDSTLAELKEALGLECTPQAIHWVLNKLGLTYKKRHSAPASRTGRTSSKPGSNGKPGKAGLRGKGSCSSTSRRRRQT
jgi:transposase